ncbi:ABC transporter permease [Leucobacter sp. M11]|uniref:ABC transporter permease n=1 Tax=Leucobacter sp. M11 TaxID=2993565 RepID=UPI002D81143C|nr:ABC transporter permease [Leucobacter sp. M11]MEB4615559.1 ABC transporter permease [Leucobacter sp. M11]
MSRFLVVRTLTLLLGLGVASVIIFLSLRLLPGDVAQVIAGLQASPERVAALREQLGLNAPLPQQYLSWIGGVLTFDLGNSVVTGSPVAGQILEKMQVTLPLVALSMLVGATIALPLGVFTAVRHGRRDSRALSALGILAAAVPIVWAGLLAIIVFSNWLGWFPSQGFPREGWAAPGRALLSLALPAITIGIVEGAVLMRFVRSATLSALNAEHVRSAMSRGHTRLRALILHGLPGVGLSIVSLLGIQIAGLIVGAVVIEQLFNLPGLGRMLVADVGQRDLLKVQSVLLVLTGIILVIGAAVDVLHRLIDPRMRTATA